MSNSIAAVDVEMETLDQHILHSQFSSGPQLFDCNQSKIDGLAFIGLNLSRHSDDTRTNGSSVTRQSQYDFNLLQDRNYDYLQSTNDDGWLVGGGEADDSFKLPSADSGHCEIMRLGTFDEELGGLSVEHLHAAIDSGDILIPHMSIIPSYVQTNGDMPPEIELKFEMEKDQTKPCNQWNNWQLQFLHNQLFQHFKFPSRFCPGPFHMTYVRKACFRSEVARTDYLTQCAAVVGYWRSQGSQCLTPETNPTAPGYPHSPLGSELTHPFGVYLYKHRKQPIQYFAPNFHPPYDTEEKQAIILKSLRLSELDFNTV